MADIVEPTLDYVSTIQMQSETIATLRAENERLREAVNEAFIASTEAAVLRILRPHLFATPGDNTPPASPEQEGK